MTCNLKKKKIGVWLRAVETHYYNHGHDQIGKELPASIIWGSNGDNSIDYD